MIARPKTYADGSIRTIAAQGRGSLHESVGENVWIECEITHPPSSEGRSVDLCIPASMVTQLLLELRRHAINARSQPMDPADVVDDNNWRRDWQEKTP